MKIEELKRIIELNKEEIEIDFSFETAKAFEDASKEFKCFFSSSAIVSTDNRKFIVSDPYLNTSINYKDFPKLISNSIFVAKKFGIETPKVAILSAVELVNLNMESSIFGAIGEAMGKRKQFGKDVFVEGPLSMDVALSEKASKEKKVLTDVAGKANVLICHRGSIARGIVEGIGFLNIAKIEIVITDGERVFKVN